MGKVTTRNRNLGKFDASGKRKAPSWEYRFEIASVSGKRQQKTKSGFRTQKEAYEAGCIAYNQYNASGRTFEPKDISMADYLDYWLESAVKNNIGHGYAYNTYVNQERKVRLHIKPAFGQYRLSSFQYSSDIIQQWVDLQKRNGKSKDMIKGLLSTLRTSLDYAITPLNYISDNPCCRVKVGKMPVNTKDKEHREYVLPLEEYRRILKRFPEGSTFYLPLLVGYYLGTRVSETYGFDLLKDLDLEHREISIRQQLIKEESTWFLRPPKYESYRTLKMGNTLKQALQREVLRRKKYMIEYGSYYMKTYRLPDNSVVQYRADMVVPYQEIWPLSVREDGKLLNTDSFKYCSRIVHYELGNLMFHSHCLRHTHGTILAENGINPKTVMERLGHKDIQTTLQIYTFNTENMQQQAVDVFEEAANK